jgi:hypothetical protein
MSLVNVPLVQESDDWKLEYVKVFHQYNDLIDSYNYLDRSYEDRGNTISELRLRVTKEDSMKTQMHRLINDIRNELTTQYRRKILKSVDWFNDLLKTYEDIGGYIKPIKTEDQYTAKATIVIDGTWRDTNRSMTEISEALIRVLGRGDGDHRVEVSNLIVEDVYDVEEISESKEG